MSRTGKFTRLPTAPDPIYKSRVVAKLINRSMYDGKKSVAQKQVYKALDLVREKSGDEPLKIFRLAIENIKPLMEVRARRIGGAAYQVPVPVRNERKESLAIRWLIKYANQRPNTQYHTYAEKLATEVMGASKNEGAAIKKRETTHKMAEANKAFAHFRW